MLRGLWRLTWLEIKIFMREPLGVIGTIVVPLAVFIVLRRVIGTSSRQASSEVPRFVSVDLPILVALLISASAVLSLVTIIAIYREGGILKRLRATPLRPHTILTAHVIVKLMLTVLTLGLMVIADRRYAALDDGVPVISFTLALLFCTFCILSLGFLIASVVPTARVAQPVGTLILYPMLGLSGLFVPIESLPPLLRMVARVLPLGYAVSLLRGISNGEGWSGHLGDVMALVAMFAVFTILSSRFFRWE